MKQTQLVMGMPITVEIIDAGVTEKDIKKIFDYFISVDERFSTYKTTSEISQINRGEIKKEQYSDDMKEIFFLSDQTKYDTKGYFNIFYKGKYDPSGVVKGWAVYKAWQMMRKIGFENFYIDAGGDIQVSGKNAERKEWTVGIRNPFNREEVVKILRVFDKGVATSGTYIRGQHIYDPVNNKEIVEEIVSVTVIGPNVYEADRFATAAFAMGKNGIEFIAKLPGCEGYVIDKKGIATFTNGLEKYIV